MDFSSLNDSQLKAVQWNSGPLLVLAGPGSGKTQVLTHRIARLLTESPDQYFRILGLTFTNKAGAEMRTRLSTLVPDAVDRASLMTFHSFAADILRIHGHHIGLKPDFTILSQEEDRRYLLRDATAESGTNRREIVSCNLLPLVTRLAELDLPPQELESSLEERGITHPSEVAKIYLAYRSLMTQRNQLDFVGLLAETLCLMREFPGIRAQVLRVYPYVCVDEFQDTSLIQYKVLKQTVNEETRNLFVVADDDQLIYQWNGASPARLQELCSDFGMGILQLPTNYRCPSRVVELANNLIAKNSKTFQDKKAACSDETVASTCEVTVKKFRDLNEEVAWVAQEIAHRPMENRMNCAVLARTWKPLQRVVEELNQTSNEGGYLLVRKSEFQSVPMQWLHFTLRLALSRFSETHLETVCRTFQILGGGEIDVADVVSRANANGTDYLRSWCDALVNLGRSLPASSTALITNSILPHLADRLEPSKFLTDALEWLENLSMSKDADSGAFCDYEEERQTWSQLYHEIEIEQGAGNLTLHALLQQLDLRSKSPESPHGAVPCLTIPGSKGMEFDHVYLVGMVEGHLPSWSAVKYGAPHNALEEERRNCFVAVTRCKKTLTLTHSEVMDYKIQTPSRFLREMGVA